MNQYIQQPLIPLALAGFLGSWVGAAFGALHTPALWMSGMVGLLLAVWRRRTCAGYGFLLLAGFFLFAHRAMQACWVWPEDIAGWIPRREIGLEGVVTNLGLVSRPDAWMGTVQSRQVLWKGKAYSVSGKVRVLIPGPMPPWNPGDRVRVWGQLKDIRPPANPGEWDYASRRQRQGIRADLKVVDSQDALRLQSASAWDPRPWVHEWRRTWIRSLRAHVPGPEQGMVLAIAVGETSALSPYLREELAAAGLAHILAVSGQNVGIVCALVFGLGWILGIPRRLVFIATGTAAFGYALATGSNTPVVRACIMLGCVLAAGWQGLKHDGLSGLAAAALILLAWRPAEAQEPGFQLSFLATAAILAAWPDPFSLAGPIRCWVDALRISTAAFAATAPLTAYYFYTVTPGSILTSLASTPCVGMIVAGGLLVRVPWLAEVAGKACAWSAQALAGLAWIASQLPGAKYYVWPPAGWWIFGLYGFVILAWAMKPCRQTVALSACVWMCAYPLFRPLPARPDELRLSFLSLNVGEATWLESGSGQRVLVDTGTEEGFLKRVKPFLASRGINRLDALVLSHADDDHAGGLTACLSFFRVSRLVHAGFGDPALNQLQSRLMWGRCPQSVRMHREEQLALSADLNLVALWPPPGERRAGNAQCLVLHVQSPQGGVLFTGDSPMEAERQWLLDRPCTVLKASHHGARYSSAEGMLLQADPSLVVVMPGNANPFGFPDPATLQRLQRSGRVVLNTDQHGAVEIRLVQGEPIRWCRWR